MTALKNNQKACICQLARRAYDQRGGLAALRETSEEFRRREQLVACGRSSLRACTQDDFAPLMAHLYKLLGEDGLAFKWLIKAQTQPARLARVKLNEALTEFGFHESYAAAICRRQYKCELDDATDRQLWKLMYTIRNRGLAGLGTGKVGSGQEAGDSAEAELSTVHCPPSTETEEGVPF